MPESDFYLDPAVAASYDADTQGMAAGQGMVGDVEFYLGLAREATPPVLELACGTGRVAIPIARAGIETVGLDASPAMLDVARRKSEGIAGLRWIQGDMSAFDLDQRFGLIFIPFRSFQLLPSVEDQRACLTCVRRHLTPDGRFALNVFNPDVTRLADWMRGHGPREHRLSDFAPGVERVRWASQSYRLASQEVDDMRVDEALDSAGRAVSRTFRLQKLRYLFRYEMQCLLELCRFEVQALYGDFHGSPFGETSTEMVWVARPA